MKPRHDIPPPWVRGSAKRDRSSSPSAIQAFTDKLVDKALLQMKLLMDRDLLCVEDIEKLQELMRAARTDRSSGLARTELMRFVIELMNRRSPPPGASPMPAPVYARGGNPPLSGAAEAPLE